MFNYLMLCTLLGLECDYVPMFNWGFSRTLEHLWQDKKGKGMGLLI